MSKGGGATLRLGRHALIPLVLALLVALAGGTAVGAAPAQPKAPDAALAAKAKALQAKLDAQHAEVERLAEQLNATEDRRDRLQRRLDGLQARQRAAQKELDAAQLQLDEQARATYMSGPQWMLGELVGGANPTDAMRRIPMQKAALEARAAVVTDVRIRKAEVDSLNERVAADLAEAQLVHQRQDDERRQVQRLATQLQATLDKIDEQLAGYLEAEAARAEAARRAAWSGYMSGVGTVQSWLQAGPVARAAVRWALAQLGDPYRWGATGPDMFDCSGLTSSAYRAAGVSIPRVSRAQWGAGLHVAVANLLPGDLVFYADNPRDPATIHHVGMYIGNGLMVHCPPHRRRGPGRLDLARELRRRHPDRARGGHAGPAGAAADRAAADQPDAADAAAHDDVAAHHPAVAGAADDPAADLDRAARVDHHHRRRRPPRPRRRPRPADHGRRPPRPRRPRPPRRRPPRRSRPRPAPRPPPDRDGADRAERRPGGCSIIGRSAATPPPGGCRRARPRAPLVALADGVHPPRGGRGGRRLHLLRPPGRRARTRTRPTTSWPAGRSASRCSTRSRTTPGT